MKTSNKIGSIGTMIMVLLVMLIGVPVFAITNNGHATTAAPAFINDNSISTIMTGNDVTFACVDYGPIAAVPIANNNDAITVHYNGNSVENSLNAIAGSKAPLFAGDAPIVVNANNFVGKNNIVAQTTATQVAIS